MLKIRSKKPHYRNFGSEVSAFKSRIFAAGNYNKITPH